MIEGPRFGRESEFILYHIGDIHIEGREADEDAGVPVGDPDKPFAAADVEVFLEKGDVKRQQERDEHMVQATCPQGVLAGWGHVRKEKA
jgi:hypothetical protein